MGGADLVTSADLFRIPVTSKFNQGPYTTTPTAALATVPEPSTSVLAAFGLVTLLVCTRCFRHVERRPLGRWIAGPTDRRYFFAAVLRLVDRCVWQA